MTPACAALSAMSAAAEPAERSVVPRGMSHGGTEETVVVKHQNLEDGSVCTPSAFN
jgi:hypothetical protein